MLGEAEAPRNPAVRAGRAHGEAASALEAGCGSSLRLSLDKPDHVVRALRILLSALRIVSHPL